MKRDESDVSLTAYMRGLFDDTWEPSYVVSNSTKEFPGYLEQFDGLENTVAIRFFTSNTPIDHHVCSNCLLQIILQFSGPVELII